MNFAVPGFGWASTTRDVKDRISIYPDFKLLTIGDFDLDSEGGIKFNSTSPGDLLNASFETTAFDATLIAVAIENAVRSYSISKDIFSKDLHEVIRSGKSNDRNLKWNIMNIFPNVQFQLHAHPNIEVIWVVRGAIHEYRLQIPPQKRDFPANDNIGPDLSQISADNSFSYGCVEASKDGVDLSKSFIINEKGSVHITFTRNEGAVLLVLWSGGHANVPLDQLPPDHSTVFKF